MEEIVLSQQSILIITLIAIWELVLKGFALWRAARKNDKLWYMLILLLNTLGIIPIIYLLVISKGKTTSKE